MQIIWDTMYRFKIFLCHIIDYFIISLITPVYILVLDDYNVKL